jgi:ABC-2 type transport system ATP-binding protein
MIEPALSIKDLTHRYGDKRALDAVSFDLPAGTFGVLLGLNGAGKSTLFLRTARLLRGQEGSIAVFGHSIERQPSAALARMGFVFQQRTLDLDLTVAEALHYHAALHGMNRRKADAAISLELARMGLAEMAGRRLRTLSGGQRRRVEIVRSLLHGPDLLLFDEATVGLDLGSRRGILQRGRELCQDEGRAALWATHLLDEVSETDHVFLLHGGRLVASGRPADLCRAADRPILASAFAKLVGLSEEAA